MAECHIKDIIEMRENGFTYRKIAEELHVTRQCVWSTAKRYGVAGKNVHPSTISRIKYNGIKKWIYKNMSIDSFCRKCGEKFGIGSRTYRFLIGDTEGDINIIKNILSVSGLTFEEAFGDDKYGKE